jgi:histidine triad (HIT) family protein
VASPDCPFCAWILRAQRVARGETIETGEVVAQNEHALAFRDPQPEARGHTLVVSGRHEPDLLALGLEEQRALWELVSQVAWELRVTQLADGVHIDADIGVGGQERPHAHVRVIPRYLEETTVRQTPRSPDD